MLVSHGKFNVGGARLQVDWHWIWGHGKEVIWRKMNISNIQRLVGSLFKKIGSFQLTSALVERVLPSTSQANTLAVEEKIIHY